MSWTGVKEVKSCGSCVSVPVSHAGNTGLDLALSGASRSGGVILVP